MHPQNVPLTGPRYWWAISAASIFGVNLGDFIARDLHLGHWQALPILLLLFGLVLSIERRAPSGTEAWYWAAVLIGRTAATNLADLGTHDWEVEYDEVILGLVPLLILLVVFGRARPPRAPGDAMPAGGVANLAYWAALFVAEVLGTALGDAIPEVLDWPQRKEFLLLGCLMTIAFALRKDARFRGPGFYWVTIQVIAIVGLSLGDYIAHSGRLWLSTLLTGAAFFGILLFWPKEKHATAAAVA